VKVLAIGNRYPPAGAGGYERLWADSVEALRGAGHALRVLTTVGEPSGPDVFRELRWWWRDFDWPSFGWRERVRVERGNAAVLRRHLDWGPDVVSWWGMGGMSLSLLEQVRRSGVPAVGVVGDAWMGYGRARDQWTRSRLAPLLSPVVGVPARVDVAAAARWLFISRALAAHAGLPDADVAHPGVDPARFRPAPAGEWRWRLACLGRVEPGKGLDVAIAALRSLPEATLTVDGPADPAYRASLEAGDRVHFIRTPADAVASAYAAADAILFPVTWPEPFGLVRLEAMSVGRPVIATGTGGSAEYLRDGENCLRVPPGDADAWPRRSAGWRASRRCAPGWWRAAGRPPPA
jgi:glycosyltransferase involved in cell wall biosynthesis